MARRMATIFPWPPERLGAARSAGAVTPGNTGKKKGGQPDGFRAAFVYAATLSAGAGRNAGITSAAKRSSCSSITDSGVPMLDCTLTASSPGN